MKNILIILAIKIFLISCIDIIKSSDEDFYESVYVQGSGWFQFYENNENENLELADDFTLQIWFSGQEETNNEAPCIASFKGNTSTISIYRNPNINNMIMIYQNDEFIRGVELDDIDLSQYTNFYLLSIIKIQNQIIIYVNDTVIKEEETIENGSWDWIDLNNNNLYDDGEFEIFIDEENGVWDEGETFTDTNGNGIWDDEEPWNDENGNGIWDEGEIFTDCHTEENTDGTIICENDPGWTEEMGNGTYDQAEEFIDGNNTYDLGEEFEDKGIPLVIINYENIKPIIGATMNNNGNPGNLWHGYIDEMRLWNIALNDTIINLHNQYPNKVSSSYNDSYLSALNGLWNFKINTSENNISNIFQDVNDNLNYTILYTLESMSNELSELGR